MYCNYLVNRYTKNILNIILPLYEGETIMVGCILTGHGQFSVGLADALRMIGGPQEDFVVVPFLEDEADVYPSKIRQAIEDMAKSTDEVVVFCDLVGGTPFNQSMLVSAEMSNVEVVAGTNLPMLLECLCTRDDSTKALQMAEMATESGRMGIDHIVLEVEDDEEDFTDGI